MAIIRLTPRWMRRLEEAQCAIDGQWMPCRPDIEMSLGKRIRAAWLVFTGRADALIWPGGQ